ncbi:hypothetical protein V4937_02345 [Histophilus somni]
MSVDLTKKPYYLKDEDIQWVKNTIANMTLEEKIGQLFVNMGSSRSEEYLTDVLNRYHIGAVRYNPVLLRRFMTKTIFYKLKVKSLS